MQPDQKLFTTGFTDRIISFIRRSHVPTRRLPMAHPMPHVPLFVSEAGAGQSGDGVLGDVIAEIDRGVGQILETLQELSIDEHVGAVHSDNGPGFRMAIMLEPIAAFGKGAHFFEGGVRAVHCPVAWHNPRRPGEWVHWMTIDGAFTIAALIDAPLPEQTIDGRDATLVLLDENRRPLPEPPQRFITTPDNSKR